MKIVSRDIKYNIDGYLYDFVPEYYDSVKDLNKEDMSKLLEDMYNGIVDLRWEIGTDLYNKYNNVISNIEILL